MNDDRVVQLLEEIRNSQRDLLEHYKRALANQEEALSIQREWRKTAARRLTYVTILIVIVLVLIFVVARLPALFVRPGQ
jgi:CHASE3 domain sensor protein